MKHQTNKTTFAGAVRWFDNNKGFGLLALPLDEQLFVHIRGFRDRPAPTLKTGDVIFGVKKQDTKRNSFVADNCHVLSGSKDWGIVISLLGKADTVLLPEVQKNEQEYSLMDLAAKQLLQGRTVIIFSTWLPLTLIIFQSALIFYSMPSSLKEISSLL